MTVAVMLALPALILPILITPKRSYVVKAVTEALSNKMVKITYQEIALKILIKIQDMVGPVELAEYLPMNVKKDFDLLCKVYGLPKSASFRDAAVDVHVPAHDHKKPWASRFVPKKDIQGNNPSSVASLGGSLNAVVDSSKYFGGNYDSTYPFERTRLSNNLGTPKRGKSPRNGSGGILRSSSENSLTIEFNGNSSGSESGCSNMSFQTQNNTAANSKSIIIENTTQCNGNLICCGGGGENKVIMETEIKINPETAVTMRILEQNASTQTDESDGEERVSPKRRVAEFGVPYPVTPMRPKNVDENNNCRHNLDSSVNKNGRRVRFGGEIVKMRTPDSDTVDQSDGNESDGHNLTQTHQKQNSYMTEDNSSMSSDNSLTPEYIKEAHVGFYDEPHSLNQFRSNIDHLKEKKFEDSRRKPSAPNADPTDYSRSSMMAQQPSMPRPDPSSYTPNYPRSMPYAEPSSFARSSPITSRPSLPYAEPSSYTRASPIISRPVSSKPSALKSSSTTQTNSETVASSRPTSNFQDPRPISSTAQKSILTESRPTSSFQDPRPISSAAQSNPRSILTDSRQTSNVQDPRVISSTVQSNSRSILTDSRPTTAMQRDSRPMSAVQRDSQPTSSVHQDTRSISTALTIPRSVLTDSHSQISSNVQGNPPRYFENDSRPLSSNRPPVVHSPTLPTTPKQLESKISSSSSTTDYSQELTIGIPDVETVLPAHFTPPNIMIKKTTPQHNFNQIRPATSPMVSPRIVTFPPTSSSSHSSKNNSPIKSAPTTPNLCSPYKRTRPPSPDRTPIRRSVSSLSPRMAHRGVTMMHNLQKSPQTSPGRSRRGSNCNIDKAGENPFEQGCFGSNPQHGSANYEMRNFASVETTPEGPTAPYTPQFKSWEELGIVDYSYLKDLRSGVSLANNFLSFTFKVHLMHFPFRI